MRLSRRDIRLALRSLARHPGFAITALLSLGLAIALNTTMYSVLDAMVNPKLDIRAPERLYWIYFEGDLRRQLGPEQRRALLESGGRTYESLTFQSGYGARGAIEYQNRFKQVTYMAVAPNLFETFGVHAVRGRLFTPEDEGAEMAPMVISERLAATLSPNGDFPVGTTVMFNGAKHPVIGIITRGSLLPEYQRPDVVMLTNVEYAIRPVPNLLRLREGATPEQLRSELKVISNRIAAQVNEDPKFTEFLLRHATEMQFHPQRFHYALFAAVIAVLLVACANLANLQLARGIGRSRELALRAALGATRADIVTHLLVESALVSAGGLLLGCVLTFWGVHFLDSRVPQSVADYVIAPQISWRVFVVAVVASILCTLLVGLLPAIHVSRVDPNELLKSGAGTGANKRNRRRYGMMVIAEIGFSLALLSGAALVVRTALDIHTVDIGYDPHPITEASIYMRGVKDTVLNAAGYIAGVRASVLGIPDVTDVAVSRRESVEGKMVTANERNGTPHEIDAPMYGYEVVTPSWFRTMGLPILQGRDFPDGLPTEPEVIVDEHTAKALWPGADPVGQQIKLGEYKSNAPWLRVVGVVKETHNYRQVTMYGVETKSSKLGAIYVSQTASDSIVVPKTGGTLLRLMIRAKAHPEVVSITARAALQPGGIVRYTSAEPLEESLGILRERERHDFVASIFVSFAVIAVALAALGIFAIVNHTIAERKRELGVRIALGASARDILHAVLREGNVIALSGVAVGLLFTKYTAGWLQAFIFEDDEYNAPVFAAMAAVLFVVAVVAALWPAFRATRIDPVESLRSE